MSKIKMSMVQSSGTWLNDCPQKQHYYVSIEIFNPEGRTSIVRVALSFEQVTRMLMYNGEVNCTLERYLGEDGKIHEEKVNPPETVHQRMKKRLDDAYKSLEKRIEDIRRDVYDMLNGNVKTGKNSLKQLLYDIDIIKSHYNSNQSFVVQEAEEEIGEIQNNAMTQLGLFIQSRITDGKCDADVIRALVPVGVSEALPDKTEPVSDNYELKERQEKSIDDMTAMEVADRINDILHGIEIKKRNTVTGSTKSVSLFNSGASSTSNKVLITYIGYHGSSALSLEEARDYLKYLQSSSGFKTHYDYKNR